MDESQRRGPGAAIGDFPAAAAVAERRVPRARIANGARAEPAPPETKEARVANLTSALRRARLANAERSDVIADLREAEVARLEILRDHLAPVLAQVPKDCDLFDVGVTHGERPRLFVDHVGFVEMGRDRRVYRFLQDTRHGRVTIGESENVATVVDAITEYIAHRLVERERALAFDFAGQGGARAFAAEARAPRSALPRRAAGLRESAYSAALFVAQGAGAAAFFGLAWLLATHWLR
ncbi:hypothetical protein [Methylosinus sp. Sm6]|uniref:hypothetical protein n=1 Tax=Methylosinus sp. Sm6 TaxID=2866948 RepID=UPI002105809C|nr:hypothetical protein [Methylosinus sp. Sm6]